MKLVALSLVSVLACACASAPKPVVAVSASDYEPPAVEQINWEEKRQEERERTLREVTAEEYQNSLVKINKTFLDEQLVIQMCSEVKQYSFECSEVRNGFCQIDVLIDSRGGKHQKLYCLAQKSDNPY
jgi:hypothetical protein